MEISYSWPYCSWNPLASGNEKQLAIENGNVEIVDFTVFKHGGSFHSYVSWPEGKTHALKLWGYPIVVRQKPYLFAATWKKSWLFDETKKHGEVPAFSRSKFPRRKISLMDVAGRDLFRFTQSNFWANDGYLTMSFKHFQAMLHRNCSENHLKNSCFFFMNVDTALEHRWKYAVINIHEKYCLHGR